MCHWQPDRGIIGSLILFSGSYGQIHNMKRYIFGYLNITFFCTLKKNASSFVCCLLRQPLQFHIAISTISAFEDHSNYNINYMILSLSLHFGAKRSSIPVFHVLVGTGPTVSMCDPMGWWGSTIQTMKKTIRIYFVVCSIRCVDWTFLIVIVIRIIIIIIIKKKKN